MQPSWDVIVIGTGILGTSHAYFAAKRGWRVHRRPWNTRVGEDDKTLESQGEGQPLSPKPALHGELLKKVENLRSFRNQQK